MIRLYHYYVGISLLNIIYTSYAIVAILNFIMYTAVGGGGGGGATHFSALISKSDLRRLSFFYDLDRRFPDV